MGAAHPAVEAWLCCGILQVGMAKPLLCFAWEGGLTAGTLFWHQATAEHSVGVPVGVSVCPSVCWLLLSLWGCTGLHWRHGRRALACKGVVSHGKVRKDAAGRGQQERENTQISFVWLWLGGFMVFFVCFVF